MRPGAPRNRNSLSSVTNILTHISQWKSNSDGCSEQLRATVNDVVFCVFVELTLEEFLSFNSDSSELLQGGNLLARDFRRKRQRHWCYWMWKREVWNLKVSRWTEGDKASESKRKNTSHVSLSAVGNVQPREESERGNEEGFPFTCGAEGKEKGRKQPEDKEKETGG